MKAKTLQIIWHSKDPVFSIDFHPDGYIATGGGDKDIKLWELYCDSDGNPHVRYASSLSGHSKTINCVRFSHSGHCLASAGDSGELLIWRPVPGSAAAAATAAGFGASTAAGCATPLSAAAAAQHKDAAAASTPGGATTSHLARSSSVEAGASAAAAAGEGGSAAVVGVWKLTGALRGHHDDVTDVAWAHDDAVVMSGSVENEVMMFDVDGRKNLARLDGHRHYVQGVAWDPLGAWMVSQSADRTVRVHGLKPPPSGGKAAAAAKEGMRASTALARDVLHTHTLCKVALQPPSTPPQSTPAAAPGAATAAAPPAAAGGRDAAHADAATAQQQAVVVVKPLQAALFHDESLNTFFRRLAWSPEGSLLAVPAGVYREYAGQTPQHATYVYARGHWGCPLLSLPCPSKASTVVRFCPRLFKLKQQQQDTDGGGSDGGSEEGAAAVPAASGAAAGGGGNSSSSGCVNALGLPYRMVLAVATMDSVLLYDMQTCEPVVLVGPLHYAPITDLAWSRDGTCLAVSSHDGYCSVVTFQPGELGEPLGDTELPEGLASALHKVRSAAAATAAKATGGVAAAAAAAGGGGGGGATPVSPKLVGAAAMETPRPASASGRPGSATAAGGGAGASTPTGAPANTPTPWPQPSGTAAAPTDMGVIGRGSRKPPIAATPPTTSSAAAGAGAPRAVQPRRVTPQPVTAADQMQPAPGFGAAVGSAPAAAAAAGAPPNAAAASPSVAAQQQQPAGAAGAAGSGGGGRVGPTAVQAALAAAAAKKKAAAKRAAEQGREAGGAAAGAGAAAGDDDVVIVGEVDAKRQKL